MLEKRDPLPQPAHAGLEETGSEARGGVDGARVAADEHARAAGVDRIRDTPRDDGRRESLFEKRRFLGGRAITNLRHGYRFNLGAHAFYRAGAGAAVYRELGIPVRGTVAKPDAIALLGSEEFTLPTNWLSLLTTGLLSLGGKTNLIKALWHVRRHGGTHAGAMTLREWMDANLPGLVERLVRAEIERVSRGR